MSRSMCVCFDSNTRAIARIHRTPKITRSIYSRWAATAGLLACLGVATVANANGDGDTEIAELRRLIQEQQRQLQVLQQRLDQLETTPAPSVAAPAPAEPYVRSGEPRVELTLSGQVNRGLLVTDDGEETEWFNVDNSNSSTRMRLQGKAAITEEFFIGTNFEVQIQSNSTSSISQDNKSTGSANFTDRKLEVILDHQRFGKLSLGQGDTASNSTAEIDLSGTSVIGYSSVADMAGGIQFRDDDTGDLSGVAIGDVFSNLDGLSRDDRVRYDTPGFNGFSAATSFIENGRWDVAGRYSATLGMLKTAAAIGYADPDRGGNTDHRLSGSLSLLHESGVNFTAAGGRDSVDGGDDPSFYYVKLGYRAKLVDYGGTNFAIDYYQGDDIDEDSGDATAYGLFVVQNLDDYGTEFYLGLRNYEYDTDDQDFDDVFAVLAGARVKF